MYDPVNTLTDEFRARAEQRRNTPLCVATLPGRLLFLNHQLPAPVQLVHDRAPLQHLQLLRLLAVKSGQLGWIRLILHMEKTERVHSEIRRMELA